MCAATPAVSRRNITCRRWLVLSGPMVRLLVTASHHATLAGDAPKNATPAPASVIFDVEPNTNTRSALPASVASARRSAIGAGSSASVCTAYALSHMIRKSGAAVGIVASRRTVSSEYTMPVGLEYFGTHQMPLTAGSAATSRSTSSMSGPSSVIGTGTSSMPRRSHTPKCRS